MYQSPATDPRAIHARELRRGLIDRSTLNKLITLYSNHNLSSHSLRVFSQIPNPNVVSWTALIDSHSSNPLSLRHFLSMLRRPTSPNHRTAVSLFKTAAILNALNFGLALHSLSIKLSLDSGPFSGSAIVSFYAKLRRPFEARRVFEEIPQRDRDDVCFSAIVVGLGQNSRPAAALSAFAEMIRTGFRSTVYSLSAALSAAAELAALEHCRTLHCLAIVVGLDRDPFVGSALVDSYGKSGLVRESRRVFDENARTMNDVGFNAMISGYAQQGDWKCAVEIFDTMVGARGFAPDKYTFLAVLTALSNAGEGVEAERWLSRMRVEFGVEPGLEHYTCLVGALGREGRLEEVDRVIESMPFEPDAAVWRAVMSAAAARGEADKARAAAVKLLELDSGDDSAYVIAANAMAAAGRWVEVAEFRTAMKNRKVSKEIGRSWIEIKGKVHSFWAGDKGHESTVEIYEKLGELMDGIERLGYVPVWDEAFRESGEDEKRVSLRCHSEKLALAYGVLSGAPAGKPVRIVKNLRICRDCHRAFEFMSRFLDREIIVRDVNRYHRFSNGVCNCNGVW